MNWKIVSLLICLDIFLKVFSWTLPPDEFSGLLYVTYNPKPITLYTFFIFCCLALLSTQVEGLKWKVLFIAGASSNFLERLFFGEVTDMIPIPVELIISSKSLVVNVADLLLLFSGFALIVIWIKKELLNLN